MDIGDCVDCGCDTEGVRVRVSDWATKFNVTIIPAAGQPGETIYRVRDLFTTRDGSWDVSGKTGSVPQWARDTYLKPGNHPQYNDDAGADHHIFGAVAQGDRLQPHGTIHYWTFNDNGNHTDQRVKLHGWANIVMWSSSSFVPERGERGPWAWAPKGVNADIVIGAGMPANQHISFWAVWEPYTVPVVIIPPIDPPDPGNGGSTLDQRVAALEAEVKRLSANVTAIWQKLDAMDGGK